MGEVIKFPKMPVRRIDKEPVNEDLELIKRRQMYSFAEGIVRDFATGMLADLEATGIIDVTDELFIRDYLYSIDVLRAGVYRNFDLDHYLQPFLDKHVKIDNQKLVFSPLAEKKQESTTEKA